MSSNKETLQVEEILTKEEITQVEQAAQEIKQILSKIKMGRESENFASHIYILSGLIRTILESVIENLVEDKENRNPMGILDFLQVLHLNRKNAIEINIFGMLMLKSIRRSKPARDKGRKGHD